MEMCSPDRTALSHRIGRHSDKSAPRARCDSDMSVHRFIGGILPTCFACSWHDIFLPETNFTTARVEVEASIQKKGRSLAVLVGAVFGVAKIQGSGGDSSLCISRRRNVSPLSRPRTSTRRLECGINRRAKCAPWTGRSQEDQRGGWCSVRGHPFALAGPLPLNCKTGEASPCSIQSSSSASKGITKRSASISLRTRSSSIFFCFRTWNRSFMVGSRPRPALCHAGDFSRRNENSSSGVEQALDRLRPLLRFLFCGHELGRPSQR